MDGNADPEVVLGTVLDGNMQIMSVAPVPVSVANYDLLVTSGWYLNIHTDSAPVTGEIRSVGAFKSPKTL